MTMFHETIAAISTPPGVGGIGIVRISGPEAVAVAADIVNLKKGIITDLPSHTIAFARIVDPNDGVFVDEVLVAVMRAPRSYTREDVVEINCHAGPAVVRQVLRMVLAGGARLAEPGEFTKRAFLSGRIDLTQAQAVMSLVSAKSEAAARAAALQADGHLTRHLEDLNKAMISVIAQLEAAIDFSDEDVDAWSLESTADRLGEIEMQTETLLRMAARGRVYDQGLATAIIGKPNVGKSSLMNALALEDRSIVSSQPGTTRDVVESSLCLGEVPLVLKDTAGWRDPLNEIEAEGIARSRRAMATADLVLAVFDGSAGLSSEDLALIDALPSDKPVVAAVNKTDLKQQIGHDDLSRRLSGRPIVAISAKQRTGLDELGRIVAKLLDLEAGVHGSELIVTSINQEEHLRAAKKQIAEARRAVRAGFTEEIVAASAKEAVLSLGKVTGRELNEKVLDEIFSKFCIGK